VVEKSSPPPLTGEQYGKMEPKYLEGGHCQSALRPQGYLTYPYVVLVSILYIKEYTCGNEDTTVLHPVVVNLPPLINQNILAT